MADAKSNARGTKPTPKDSAPMAKPDEDVKGPVEGVKAPEAENEVKEPVAPNVKVDPPAERETSVTKEEAKYPINAVNPGFPAPSHVVGHLGVTDTSDTAGISPSESQHQMTAAIHTDAQKYLIKKSLREKGVDVKDLDREYEKLMEARREERRNKGLMAR